MRSIKSQCISLILRPLLCQPSPSTDESSPSAGLIYTSCFAKPWCPWGIAAAPPSQVPSVLPSAVISICKAAKSAWCRKMTCSRELCTERITPSGNIATSHPSLNTAAVKSEWKGDQSPVSQDIRCVYCYPRLQLTVPFLRSLQKWPSSRLMRTCPVKIYHEHHLRICKSEEFTVWLKILKICVLVWYDFTNVNGWMYFKAGFGLQLWGTPAL